MERLESRTRNSSKLITSPSHRKVKGSHFRKDKVFFFLGLCSGNMGYDPSRWRHVKKFSQASTLYQSKAYET